MTSGKPLTSSSMSLLDLDNASSSISSVLSVPAELATMIVSSATSHPASTAFPSSSTLSAVMTAVASTMASSDDKPRPGANNGECKLLGPFALFIQGALGALALLSLVYKRWRERPQRPVKIWAFDASKQVVGSILLHMANLLMSMLSSGQLSVTISTDRYQANPCSFYLLNLAIDTTIGIPILIVLLRLLTIAFLMTPLGDPPESIQSGNYGRPAKAAWWLKQSFIYFLGLLGMKLCVFFIFQICPWIVRVGDWALRWTEGNEMVQVFFVMLFFPVVMNALQYYIIDSFIKDQKPSDHEPISGEDQEDADQRHGGRHRSIDHASDSDTDDEAEPLKKAGVGKASKSREEDVNLKGEPKKLDEYDPDRDGSRSVGSSSNSGDRDKPLPPPPKKP